MQQICRVEWHRGTQRWTRKERLAWQRVEVRRRIRKDRHAGRRPLGLDLEPRPAVRRRLFQQQRLHSGCFGVLGVRVGRSHRVVSRTWGTGGLRIPSRSSPHQTCCAQHPPVGRGAAAGKPELPTPPPVGRGAAAGKPELPTPRLSKAVRTRMRGT